MRHDQQRSKQQRQWPGKSLPELATSAFLLPTAFATIGIGWNDANLKSSIDVPDYDPTLAANPNKQYVEDSVKF